MYLQRLGYALNGQLDVEPAVAGILDLAAEALDEVTLLTYQPSVAAAAILICGRSAWVTPAVCSGPPACSRCHPTIALAIAQPTRTCPSMLASWRGGVRAVVLSHDPDIQHCCMIVEACQILACAAERREGRVWHLGKHVGDAFWPYPLHSALPACAAGARP